MAAKRENTEDLTEIPQKKPKTDGTNRAKMNPSYTNPSAPVYHRFYHTWNTPQGEEVPLPHCSELQMRVPYSVGFLTNCFYELDEEKLAEGVRYRDALYENNGFLFDLKEELESLTLNQKKNDLYQYSQSEDLRNFDTPCILEFRRLMVEEMLPWLERLTGIQLSKDISMTCSKYTYTDYLLCHDDQLDDRRIAFIYYLPYPNWCTNNGGVLDLYDTDENAQPREILKKICPRWNKFVFFEVTSTSFHQIGEIVSTTAERLSINGWFHAPPVPRPPPYIEPPLEFMRPKDLPLEVLEEWINPMYLDIGIQCQIQQQFEEDSQIELPDFFTEAKYADACKALGSLHDWNECGPPNRRYVFKASNTAASSTDVMNLLLSDPFCLLLSHITGLQLSDKFSSDGSDPVPNNETESSSQSLTPTDSSGYCRGDVFLWKPGCYTLMHPQEDFVLELTLHFNVNDWTSEMGGTTTFVMKDEDEELLSISPQSNSLCLVYKDKHTMSYVQYLNVKGKGHHYHSVSALYKEGGNQASGRGEGGHGLEDVEEGDSDQEAGSGSDLDDEEES